MSFVRVPLITSRLAGAFRLLVAASLVWLGASAAAPQADAALAELSADLPSIEMPAGDLPERRQAQEEDASCVASGYCPAILSDAAGLPQQPSVASRPNIESTIASSKWHREAPDRPPRSV